MKHYRLAGITYNLPPGSTVVKAYGDIHQVHDICGRMGLCPECASKNANAIKGCGNPYTFMSIRGAADARWTVEFPDGHELAVDEVW